MRDGSSAEHILQAAQKHFLQDFEAQVRKRLMTEVEQEVEHMVRELSDRLASEMRVSYSHLDKSFLLDHRVTFNAR